MPQYDVDLRDYWRIIKKRKSIIVLMVLLVVIIIVGHLLHRTLHANKNKT